MAYYSAVITLSDSDSVLPDLLQATFPARRLQYEAKNRSHRAWHMWEAVGESAQQPLIRMAEITVAAQCGREGRFASPTP